MVELHCQPSASEAQCLANHRESKKVSLCIL